MSQRRAFRMLAALAFIAATAPAFEARAATRSELEAQVIEWAGSGPNSVYVVVDFDQASTLSRQFVFGARFTSATVTGRQAMDILAGGTSLTFVDAGGFIDAIGYTYKGTTYEFGAPWPAWWSYWETPDYGDTWSSHVVGFATRVMSDGDVDGWRYYRDGFPAPAPNGPTTTPRDALSEDVIEWAGTGPNEAFVVVDFDQASTLSREFVFGVRFTSPTLTGRQAMTILTGETALTLAESFGFVDAIGYTHKGTTWAFGDPWPAWWSYWGSDDYGTSWTSHLVGYADRVMSDGDVDGWRYYREGFPAPPPNGPRTTPRTALEEDLIEWVGTGPFRSYILVDFDQASTTSEEFAFGVRYTSPTITGRQAMEMLAAGTSLSFNDAGGFVDRIGYAFKDRSYDRSGVYPVWWSYWGSGDFGGEWFSHLTSFAERTLEDGRTDAWRFYRDGFPAPPPNGPRTTPRTALEEDRIARAGSGPFRAYVVIDFDASTTDSAEFVFSVDFTSPTITGRQAMEILAAQTGLSLVDAGGYLDEISYDGPGGSFSGTGPYPMWWSYWGSEDYSRGYTSHMVGYGTRLLEDGDTDGWAHDKDGFPAQPPNGPRVPPAPTAAAGWLFYE